MADGGASPPRRPGVSIGRSGSCEPQKAASLGESRNCGPATADPGASSGPSSSAYAVNGLFPGSPALTWCSVLDHRVGSPATVGVTVEPSAGDPVLNA